jgi:hypothetical protein
MGGGTGGTGDLLNGFGVGVDGMCGVWCVVELLDCGRKLDGLVAYETFVGYGELEGERLTCTHGRRRYREQRWRPSFFS